MCHHRHNAEQIAPHVIVPGLYANDGIILYLSNYFLIIFEAINANRPKTNPETMPTIGPVISIISLGESGAGILAIIAASCA